MKNTAKLPTSVLLASAALMAQGTVTLDRIALIVGKHVIKSSDIEHDIRLTAFLNHQTPDFSSKTKRQSAERLIDQELIRQELATGSYQRPTEADAMALQSQLVHDRFGGSEAALRRALSQSDLTPEQFATQLLWQLTVLRFIDQRFRPGVSVSDDEVQLYARQHQAELQKQDGGASAEILQSQAREILEGERVNQNLNTWLERARMRTRIEYKQEAFG